MKTALLPLDIDLEPLGKDQTFPLGGGAVALAGDRILVLDRLGGIYIAGADQHLQRLDYGEFPSRLREFITQDDRQLNIDTLRAHSIAYDPLRGTV